MNTDVKILIKTVFNKEIVYAIKVGFSAGLYGFFNTYTSVNARYYVSRIKNKIALLSQRDGKSLSQNAGKSLQGKNHKASTVVTEQSWPKVKFYKLTNQCHTKWGRKHLVPSISLEIE